MPIRPALRCAYAPFYSMLITLPSENPEPVRIVRAYAGLVRDY